MAGYTDDEVMAMLPQQAAQQTGNAPVSIAAASPHFVDYMGNRSTGGPQRGLTDDELMRTLRPDVPTPSEMPWSDVPRQAISNLPSSAVAFGKSIVQPFIHPIDTIGNLGDVAAGGLRNVAHRVLPEPVFNALDSVGGADTAQRIEQKADAVGQHYKDRYGSIEGLKHAMAQDPVGALADASAVATAGGGALARTAGPVATIGQTIGNVGSAINPISGAGRLANAAGRTIASSLGVATGAGERPFVEAYRAGNAGNQAFTDNMRGNRPVGDVVDMADSAVNQMGRDRSTAYKAGMSSMAGPVPPAPVTMLPIRQAIQNATDIVYHKGVAIDQKAADAMDAVNDIVTKFENASYSPTHMGVDTADAMKRAVNEIRKRTMQGTLESTAVNQVYNAIKNEIVAQVPDYAKTMRDYANASDNIGEMRRTMSINDKASADTTLRKLQSTMRNNVNTNYGQRERLLDVLARYQPDLPAALAGQSLNSISPRGLARVSPMTMIAAGGATMHPLALATLPLTSPRLMGEAAYGAGSASRMMRDSMGHLGLTPAGAVPGVTAMGATGAAMNAIPPYDPKPDQ